MHQGQLVAGVAQQAVELRDAGAGQVAGAADRQVVVADAGRPHGGSFVETGRLAVQAEVDHLPDAGALQRGDVACLQSPGGHAVRRRKRDMGKSGHGGFLRRGSRRGAGGHGERQRKQ